MKEITYVSALRALVQAMKENGKDYVFTDDNNGLCRYFDEDTKAPSCVVGHVLASHGIFFESIERFNTSTFDVLAQQDWMPCDTTSPATVLLDTAQQWQDSGNTWEESVRAGVYAANHYAWMNAK